MKDTHVQFSGCYLGVDVYLLNRLSTIDESICLASAVGACKLESSHTNLDPSTDGTGLGQARDHGQVLHPTSRWGSLKFGVWSLFREFCIVRLVRVSVKGS